MEKQLNMSTKINWKKLSTISPGGRQKIKIFMKPANH